MRAWCPILSSRAPGGCTLQRRLGDNQGRRRTCADVPIELTWLGRAFVGQFLLIDDTVGILGRNVLNALVLVLDGLHLRWRAR